VIAGELRSKGVSQDIINEVIDDIDDESEYSQAFSLAQSKYNAISHLDPEVIYRRISGLLMRKGYGHGVCAKIMRELFGKN
jgi:regulatory protein